jgi:hypothetical protein
MINQIHYGISEFIEKWGVLPVEIKMNNYTQTRFRNSLVGLEKRAISSIPNGYHIDLFDGIKIIVNPYLDDNWILFVNKAKMHAIQIAEDTVVSKGQIFGSIVKIKPRRMLRPLK